MKRVVFCLVLCGIICFLTGCGDRVIEEYSDEKTYNLEVSIWGGEVDLETLDERIAGFENLYSNINVDVIHLPDNYDQAVQIMMVGNKAPDLIQVNEGVNQYASRNQILPLNDFIKQYGINIEERFGKAASLYEYKREQYAFPDRGAPITFYYNKDIFDANGVDYPNENWTWDDLINAAVALTSDDEDIKEKTYGFPVGDWWGQWMNFIYQNGGRIIDENGIPVINSPENIEAMKFYKDLVYKWKVSPSKGDYQDMGISSSDTLFLRGKSAMHITGWWLVGSLNNVNVNWDIAPMFGNKEKGAVPFTTGFAINRRSKHPEAAFKLLDYITSEEGQKIIVKNKLDVPVDVKVLSNEFLTQTWSEKGDVNLDAIVETSKDVIKLPNGPYWNELQDIIKNEFDLMLMNQKSVEDALDATQENLESMMDNYNFYDK